MGSPLNQNPLDLIEADLIASPIVELRRARQGMVCHHRCLSNVPPFLR
jgi:hypothetical protein